MNGTQLEIKYGSKIINSDNCNEFMLVIADQNSRNIIQGKTNEFILGENIQLQYELKDKIDSQANSLWRECKQVLEKYAINKKSSPLIGYFRQSHRDSIEKIANRRSTPGPIEDIKKTIEPFQNHIATKSTHKISLSKNDQKIYTKDINEAESSCKLHIHMRIL